MNAPQSNEERNADFAAYPSSGDCTKGLTKRELFAAMALQGLLTQSSDSQWIAKAAALNAVSYADALLTALEQVTK